MFGTNKNELLFHIANLNFQILCEQKILILGCASNYSGNLCETCCGLQKNDRTIHNQQKTAEVCLVQTKTLPTSIYKYWCEGNIIYN